MDWLRRNAGLIALVAIYTLIVFAIGARHGHRATLAAVSRQIAAKRTPVRPLTPAAPTATVEASDAP